MKQLIPLLFLASPLLADSNEVAINPCPSGVVGLCTPSETSVIIDTLIEEEIIQEPDGVTTIITTTETVETTIVTNVDSGDILHSDSEFVEERYEGDMDQDWGGQGPASMPTGEACRGIKDSGRCAGINGTGSFTTKQGVENVGTTYVQTITPPSSLTNPVTKGGRTTYSIDVDKNDKEDSVYIHITGNNEDGVAFSGTDILSASGVESGFQTYTGGFDFSGGLTSMTVEIGGRNLGVSMNYALFDNVSINVIYNAIQTIIDYHVTTMELFVALDVVVDDTVTEVIENILVNNDITITPEGDLEIIPIDLPDVEVNYESVKLEIDVSIEEFDVPEIESFDTVETEVEIEVVEVSMEVEEVKVAEVKLEPKPKAEPQPESEPEPEESVENVQKETKQEEPEPNKEPEENQEEAKSEDQDSKQDAKVEKSNTVKDKQQTAAKKILTKMGDKGKYDNTNQIKTLLVMQVLGNTKSFFDDQQVIQDTQGFFPTTTIKDTEILDNGLASFVMFGGSNAKMDRLIDTQYDRRVTWQK